MLALAERKAAIDPRGVMLAAPLVTHQTALAVAKLLDERLHRRPPGRPQGAKRRVVDGHRLPAEGIAAIVTVVAVTRLRLGEHDDEVLAQLVHLFTTISRWGSDTSGRTIDWMASQATAASSPRREPTRPS